MHVEGSSEQICDAVLSVLYEPQMDAPQPHCQTAAVKLRAEMGGVDGGESIAEHLGC